jgi:opacity protein-like surface antigen
MRRKFMRAIAFYMVVGPIVMIVQPLSGGWHSSLSAVRVMAQQRDTLQPIEAIQGPEKYPKFGFGFGWSTNSLDAGTLQPLIRAIENAYRRPGYSIKYQTLQLEASSLLWFSIGIRFSKEYEFLVQFGVPKSDLGATLKTLCASFLYSPAVFPVDWVQPYFGAGIGRYRFSTDNSLGYGDRISPIDTLGRYYYLNAINISGSESKTGFTLECGVEIGRGASPKLNLYGLYIGLPSFTVRATNEWNAPIEASGFIVGARLHVYL